jgi:hypothetical protein
MHVHLPVGNIIESSGGTDEKYQPIDGRVTEKWLINFRLSFFIIPDSILLPIWFQLLPEQQTDHS